MMLKEGLDYDLSGGFLTIAWDSFYRAYRQTQEFFGLTPMAEDELMVVVQGARGFCWVSDYQVCFPGPLQKCVVFNYDAITRDMRVFLLGK